MSNHQSFSKSGKAAENPEAAAGFCGLCLPKHVHPAGVVDPKRSTSYEIGQGSKKQAWHLSDKCKITIRALCAVLVYFLIVLILILPQEDMWSFDKTYSVVDALYFASVTLSTVGYGDVLPKSDSMKLITCGLIFLGFTCIMYLLGELAQIWIIAMEKKNAELAKEMAAMDLDNDGNPDVQEGGLFALIHNPRFNKGANGLVLVLVNTFIGMAAQMVGEDANFVDALYFSVVTTTTVGYGDIGFTKWGTRLFATFWLPVAPIITTYALGIFVEAIIDLEGRLHRQRMDAVNQEVDTDTFKKMDQDGDGTMTEIEFVVKRLEQMDLLKAGSESYVADLRNVFKSLDKDGSGSVNIDELAKQT
mmetsp:Transcript_6812/g.9228  ORF Transcript_6812/g.9228 Transcript_6812/m.9228 type:complete len:361 (+) Transcript_6812:173-1255(+)